MKLIFYSKLLPIGEDLDIYCLVYSVKYVSWTYIDMKDEMRPFGGII